MSDCSDGKKIKNETSSSSLQVKHRGIQMVKKPIPEELIIPATQTFSIY